MPAKPKSTKGPQHLPPWREVARPHPDIIQKRFDLSVFAANLHEVHKKLAAPDYQQPERFFAKTYLTQGLREMVAAVLRRLAERPGGEAVVDLITSFGGGKTHALLCLYHLAQAGPAAKKWAGVPEVLKEAGLDAPPKARVAVISGEDISPVKALGWKGEPLRRTLWGELAWQLGGAKGYDSVKASDEKMVAPTADEMARLVAGDKPTLILVDEALQYISRARGEKVKVVETTLASQTFNFFKALSEAVSRTDNAAMVVTLPASILEMNKEDEEDYRRLSHLFRRVERTRRLAEGDEIYEIVRRRLFEKFEDAEATKQVAGAYMDYYQRHAGDFPKVASTPAYARKLERAYPFHPEFLDTLNERWSSITNFQRTRGVLRMLAILVGDLYQGDSAPLIHISSAHLSNRDFRSEVLGQIDARQFDAVIESDVAGTGARAQHIDAEGNETYQREHLAERTATAIFLNSFGGASGVAAATVPQLRLAVLQPGLEPAFIPDVLDQMRKRLYYLDADGGQFRFTVQPNLNAIRVDQEASVEPDKIEELVKSEVQRQVKGEKFRAILFPGEPGEVPDQPALTLAVAGPDRTWGKTTKAATERFVKGILAGGTTHRSNRNALVFLVAAEEGNQLRAEARTRLALDAVERLYARTGKLADAQKRDLQNMLEDSRKALQQAVWSAYSYVLTPGEGDRLEEHFLGRLLQREGRSLQDEVWKRLEDRERIASKLGPSQLASDRFPVWPKESQALSLKALKDAFAQYTYLPMLPDHSVLRQCVAEGVKQGLFGLGLGDGREGKFGVVHFKVPMDPAGVDFVDSAWLLRPDLVRRLQQAQQQVEAGVVEPEVAMATESAEVPEPPPAPPGAPAAAYRTVVVEGDLDWKKWADFYDGVIKPLIQAGATVQVHVRTEASSSSGIPRNVVDITVRENISQRGLSAKVLSEAEEKRR